LSGQYKTSCHDELVFYCFSVGFANDFIVSGKSDSPNLKTPSSRLAGRASDSNYNPLTTGKFFVQLRAARSLSKFMELSSRTAIELWIRECPRHTWNYSKV
jgi:predicted AAA+ superfamily ATPase